MKQVKSIDARIKKSGSHMVLVPFVEKPTMESAETSDHFVPPVEKSTMESAETSHHFAAVIPTTLPNTDCGSFLVFVPKTLNHALVLLGQGQKVMQYNNMI